MVLFIPTSIILLGFHIFLIIIIIIEGPDLMYHFALEGFTMYTKQYGYPTAQHMFSVTPNVMRAQSMVLLPLLPPPPPKCDRHSNTLQTKGNHSVGLEGLEDEA